MSEEVDQQLARHLNVLQYVARSLESGVAAARESLKLDRLGSNPSSPMSTNCDTVLDLLRSRTKGRWSGSEPEGTGSNPVSAFQYGVIGNIARLLPVSSWFESKYWSLGRLAQLGECLLDTQEAGGSRPSTTIRFSGMCSVVAQAAHKTRSPVGEVLWPHTCFGDRLSGFNSPLPHRRSRDRHGKPACSAAW